MRKFTLCTLIAWSLLLPSSMRGESSLSSLGWGLLNESAGIRAAGMGYASLAVLDSVGLNLRSGAHWRGPATTRFGIQGVIDRTITADIYGEDVSDEPLLAGLGIAMPLGRGTFFGVALSPYTRVKYLWSSTDTTGWAKNVERQRGEGGITQGLIAASIPLGQKHRFALEARTMFGKIDRKWNVSFSGVNANSAGIIESVRFNGIGWGLSWSYQDHTTWLGGISVKGPIGLNAERGVKITTNTKTTLVDSSYDVEESYGLPFETSAGLGLMPGDHLFTLETAWHGWESVQDPEPMAERFRNSLRVSVGWEYTPKYRPFDPIWKLPAYRAGVYYRQHYVLSPGDHQPERIGFTGGVTVPYNDNRSRIDIALEYGWIGSKSDDDIREQTISLSIGFWHSEHWFVSRRERR